MSEYIFSGMKVLDAGTWIAGPVAATIMADFGADVTKIEMPGAGDQYRILSGSPCAGRLA
jgi:formyl-CoA transferase